MSTGVLVGFVLTGVFMIVFMLWTWHELRRVDEIAGPSPDGDPPPGEDPSPDEPEG